MIHDAHVEVTCDGEGCSESIFIALDYTYGGLLHSSGSYESDDRKIEQKLIRDEEWLVTDGKHYCSDSCQPDDGDGP